MAIAYAKQRGDTAAKLDEACARMDAIIAGAPAANALQQRRG